MTCHRNPSPNDHRGFPLSADKGNARVIMNTTDYIQKMTSLLQDPSYRILPKGPTESTEKFFKIS